MGIKRWKLYSDYGDSAMCETGNQPAGHWHPVSEDDYVLHADHAAEVARLEARVAELTQLHADACFDRNLAQTERDSLRAQLEAAKAQLTTQPDGVLAIKALSVIADYPETWCRGCNWAGPDDYVIKQGVDMCPHCQSEKLEDFCAGEYATQALAASAPVCVCGHSKADHAEKHGWECSEECACLKYTPAPACDGYHHPQGSCPDCAKES